MHKAWNSKGEMPYCFPRSSIKFQGHTVQNITDFDPNWAFPDYRPVAAVKSLRFALFKNLNQSTKYFCREYALESDVMMSQHGKTFVLVVHCEGKPSVDSSHKTPVIRSFDIFVDGELNKLLQKLQSCQ